MIILLSHSEDALTYSVPYRNLENTAGFIKADKNDANRKKLEQRKKSPCPYKNNSVSGDTSAA